MGTAFVAGNRRETIAHQISEKDDCVSDDRLRARARVSTVVKINAVTPAVRISRRTVSYVTDDALGQGETTESETSEKMSRGRRPAHHPTLRASGRAG